MSIFSKITRGLARDVGKLGKVPIIGKLIKPLAPVIGTVLGPVGAAVGAVSAAVGLKGKLHGAKGRTGGKRGPLKPTIQQYPTVYDSQGNAYFDASGGGGPGQGGLPGLPAVPGMEASVLGDLGQGLGNMLTGGYQTGRAAAESLTGPTGGGGIPTRHGVLQGRMAPSVKVRRVHKCLAGYALARDGYCYPKAMLPRWARKWRPEPKPVLSHSTVKAIRKAEHARKRLVKLTKEAGAHASLKAPSTHRALPPGRKRR